VEEKKEGWKEEKGREGRNEERRWGGVVPGFILKSPTRR
jgi:hypothetical protein